MVYVKLLAENTNTKQVFFKYCFLKKKDCPTFRLLGTNVMKMIIRSANC